MFNAMRTPLIFLALLSVAFAGCADEGAVDPVEQVESTKEVQATATTGGIRGVVVDNAITPLADVAITLQGQDKEATTDSGGEFVFNNLDPGVYFLQTAHPLYIAVQQTATVEAGVSDPAPVKILLVRNEVAEPTLETLSFNGHVKCSTNIMFVGYSEECGEGMGYPCDVPDTVYECGERIGRTDGSSPQLWFTVEENPQSIIVEQVWTPSLSLATGNTKSFRTHIAIDWICDPFCGGDRFAAVVAESPLYLRADADVLDPRAINPETDISTFVYSGSDNGVILEQKYEQYVTITHGLQAPEGWSFVNSDEYPF